MKISFIGAGNMAGAIINSLITSGRAFPKDISVFDINSEKSMAFSKLGLNVCKSQKDAVEVSHYIVLAVKPQDYETVLLKILEENNDISSKIFISIAAGISTSFVSSTLKCEKLGVIRVMPNTPLLIGHGATAISRNEYVADKDYTRICGMFASSGVVLSLPEDKMNCVIGVNSSSPAYVYLFAKALIDGAVEQGIDEKSARELVYETIKGSAMMLINSGKSPDELINMVASPKGTTLAALNSLYEDNFVETIKKAMLSCTQRAEELKK